MNLTADNVESIFKDCLGEREYADAIEVTGVCISSVFKKSKIESHKTEIYDMLMQLPEPFMLYGDEARPGGSSFLNMCIDKNDIQWTDSHFTMDKLICLGLAIGKLVFLIARDFWHYLPGGVPYIYIDNTDYQPSTKTKN